MEGDTFKEVKAFLLEVIQSDSNIIEVKLTAAELLIRLGAFLRKE